MNKEAIKNYLEENEIENFEIIEEKDGMILARMFYNYDDEEIAAAELYGQSLGYDEDEEDYEGEEDNYGDGDFEQDSIEVFNSDEMNESEIDIDEIEEDEEFEDDDMYGYLSDIAIDHVGEVLEELKEDLDIDVQYVGYDLDEDHLDSYEFVAMFFENGKDYDIEEELEKLDL